MAERLAIIGLGRMGASLGLALKRAGLPGVEIWGHDKDPLAHSQARKMGAVDRVHPNLIATVEGARLVVLAIPVGAMEATLQAIGPHLHPGAVVTDMGSTKAQVLRWARLYLPEGVSFVGGHPLAGGGARGTASASADLFQGAAWCIVPSPTAHRDAVQAVVGMVEAVGAQPLFIDPDEHDSYMAMVELLPVLASFALMGLATESPAWRELARMAGSHFRDATLLAGTDPLSARDACATSPDAVAHWLDRYIQHLARLRQLVQAAGREGSSALKDYLVSLWEAHERWQAGVREEAGPRVPGASDAFRSLFVGEWLAERTREIYERERRDPHRYPDRG